MKKISENEPGYVCDIRAKCFLDLSTEEQSFIRSSRTQVQFRKGENLSKQGAFASYVLFMIDGLAKQYVEGGSSNSYNIQLLHPGDFIGLSSLFDANTYHYSTVAVTPATAILIEKEAIRSVLIRNGEFAFGIMGRYCRQDILLYDIISRITYKQMNGRLADTLLYLSSERFKGEDVFIHLSRKDLAEFSGISTESAVKLLKRFEQDGLIRLDEKDIVITDRNALTEISHKG